MPLASSGPYLRGRRYTTDLNARLNWCTLARVEQTVPAQIRTCHFETSPDHYKHWKLTFDGPVATLAMDVKEDAGLRPHDYKLKLNSYDLGVDIELADALQRIRFEHPEVHAVVVIEPQAAHLLRRRQHLHARHARATASR